MGREDLIRYLQACIDAEAAAYESARLASVLKQQYEDYDRRVYFDPLPNLPGEPQPAKAFEDRRQFARECLEDHERQYRSAVLSLDFGRMRELKARIAEDKERVQKAEEDYELRGVYERRCREEYQKAHDAWKEKNDKYHTAIRMEAGKEVVALDQERKKQEELTAHFQEIQRKLYDAGVLYEEFRNVDAALALKRYLEMGVADRLEGSDGAYRLYLEDQRNDRLVGSVEELRRSVEKGFAEVAAGQRELAAQMSQMNENLQEMDRGIRQGFDQLINRVTETGLVIAGTIAETSAYEQELLAQLHRDNVPISQMIATSAYNRYLVDRKNNLDNYLVYMLQNPLI